MGTPWDQVWVWGLNSSTRGMGCPRKKPPTTYSVSPRTTGVAPQKEAHSTEPSMRRNKPFTLSQRPPATRRYISPSESKEQQQSNPPGSRRGKRIPPQAAAARPFFRPPPFDWVRHPGQREPGAPQGIQSSPDQAPLLLPHQHVQPLLGHRHVPASTDGGAVQWLCRWSDLTNNTSRQCHTCPPRWRVRWRVREGRSPAYDYVILNQILKLHLRSYTPPARVKMT